jgi:hypothetical protein
MEASQPETPYRENETPKKPPPSQSNRNFLPSLPPAASCHANASPDPSSSHECPTRGSPSTRPTCALASRHSIQTLAPRRGRASRRNRASRFARRDERASSTARRVSGGASLVRRAGRDSVRHRRGGGTPFSSGRTRTPSPERVDRSGGGHTWSRRRTGAARRTVRSRLVRQSRARGGHPRRPGAALQIWRG